jgi:hypothetical protein
MKYAAEIGSGAKMQVLSIIKIGSSIHKLTRGYSQTCRQHGHRISPLHFLNKESKLKSETSNISWVSTYFST